MNEDRLRTYHAKKALWTTAFALYAGAILYGSVYPVQKGAPVITIPGADKLIHSGEFIILILIGYRAIKYYLERNRILPALLIGSLFYGGLTELVQLLVPYRTASVFDWVADCVGVIIGLAIIALARKWSENRKQSYQEKN